MAPPAAVTARWHEQQGTLVPYAARFLLTAPLSDPNRGIGRASRTHAPMLVRTELYREAAAISDAMCHVFAC